MGSKDSTPAQMEGPLLCSTFHPHSRQLLDSLLMSQAVEGNKEDTQYTYEPLVDLICLFRTTNECHSNEHSQN